MRREKSTSRYIIPTLTYLSSVALSTLYSMFNIMHLLLGVLSMMMSLTTHP